MSNNEYVQLNAIELLNFMNSGLGQLIYDGISYYTQGQPAPSSIAIQRCASHTDVTIGVLMFSFRHWMSGVAGMAIYTEGKAAPESYAHMNGEWVLLF